MNDDTIERSARFKPHIKGIDYGHLNEIMERHNFYVYGTGIRERM